MAESDIATLSSNLPEVFEERPPRGDDWNDVIFVDITFPGEPYGSQRSPNLADAEDLQLDEGFFDQGLGPEQIGSGLSETAGALISRIPGGYPGALTVAPKPTPVPPPDCLAFYLPYHYFYPQWWGVYLLLDGVAMLASWIQSEARQRGYGSITRRDCWIGARLFLFYHEIYHHNVESFATRLEVTHRQPLYKSGFSAFYAKTAGTSNCIEESLAEANAWRKATNPRFYNKGAVAGMKEILAEYIRRSPPGYAEGLNYLTANTFTRGQNEFAERNHQVSITPTPAGKKPVIWSSAKYLFRGFTDKARGRAKYVISKHSPLAARLPLRPRLKPLDVKKRLANLGCAMVRQGGNHEMWQCPGTRPFPIPRHPGDLATGTLRKIIKQAGLDLSVEQFVAAK
jgi:predicted RNA binding protein YcfA (HicA-like mRNA interferase family)